MAHYFLFPEKDATIYSHPLRKTLNTGIDEILTISDEDYFGRKYPSRALIQFKTTEIKDTINNIIGSNQFSASLKLYETEHTNLSINQDLEVYPLAEGPWDNGTGRYENRPLISDGVSWDYKDNATTKTSWTISGYGTGITGSWSSSAAGGGSWYTGSGFEVDRTYGYGDDLDLSFDVTSPITKIYSSSQFSSTYPNGIVNNGFILKRSASQEFSDIDDGTLNFFSLDTHTIYPPYLDLSWDDSSYITGSGTVLTSGDIYMTLRNNKQEYRTVEERTFRLNVRPLYPTRKFVTTSNYLDVNYFTSESYYSLIDYATEETIVPFDDHTKLSADAEGMYFKLYMNGLEPGRYYKLLFKHNNNDGITVHDEDCYFKVVE
tara:strand:+ start:3775 stop:4902 length:1128 start_codon:yes stop_codon:yes gene_type:complete